MKPGLEEGQTATIYARVTPEMFTQFDGTVIHPAYSTVTMVYHMESASRQIILPYLEDDEEGMEASATFKQIAPAGEGARVTITATLTELNKNLITTKIVVKSEQKLIGIGEVKQVIMPKKKINAMLKRNVQNS